MIRYDITRFGGSWVDSSGYRLKIKKLNEVQATVDFLDPSGIPVCRPYMNDAPSLVMVAHYDDYIGSFEVDLWEAGRGFILDLSHEYDYELDEKGRCDGPRPPRPRNVYVPLYRPIQGGDLLGEGNTRVPEGPLFSGSGEGQTGLSSSPGWCSPAFLRRSCRPPTRS